jgi:hypothetical protein
MSPDDIRPGAAVRTRSGRVGIIVAACNVPDGVPYGGWSPGALVRFDNGTVWMHDADDLTLVTTSAQPNDDATAARVGLADWLREHGGDAWLPLVERLASAAAPRVVVGVERLNYWLRSLAAREGNPRPISADLRLQLSRPECQALGHRLNQIQPGLPIVTLVAADDGVGEVRFSNGSTIRIGGGAGPIRGVRPPADLGTPGTPED